MKFCTDHWEALRGGIKDRGLDHLVLQSGTELLKRVESELKDKATDKDWDPLASATWMIYGAAIKTGGLYLMTKKQDGTDYCPLCEARDHIKDVDPPADIEWITGCLNEVLAEAKRKGLVQ